MFFSGVGGMPSPGTPDGGSSNLLSQYAQQSGITLGQTAGPSNSAMNPNSSSFDPNQALLWMGRKKVGQYLGSTFVTSKQDKTLTYAQILQNFDQLKPNEKRQMAAYLALAGYLGNDNTYEDVDSTAMAAPVGMVRAAYEQLVQDTLDRQRSLHQKVTPTQLLERSIAYRLAGDGVKWDGKFDSLNGMLHFKSLAGEGLEHDKNKQKKLPQDGDTKTLSSTSTARDIMDPEDAKGLTRAMLQQELGRDPTQAEYEDFIAMLQHAQAANPSTQTTTSNMVYDSTAGGWRTVSDSSTTHQGIGADGLQQMALEKAQAQPDWAEWQAVGTYAPALFSALGATVPGVGGS